MKNAVAIFFAVSSMAGPVIAQEAQGDRITGIEISTDPARAAEVERKAQEVAARQEPTASGASGTSGASGASGSASEPTSADQQKGAGGEMRKPHRGGSDSSRPRGGSSGRQ